MGSAYEIRPLSGLEQYSSSRHSLGLYYGLAVTCRYAPPQQLANDAPTLRRIIQRALEDVILSQPCMRVGIKDENTTSPVFVRLDSLDLDVHLRWIELPAQAGQDEDVPLLRFLEEDLALPFPDIQRQPPWRVLCAQLAKASAVDIVVKVHHAIADGMSARLLHEHLLRALVKATAAGDSEPQRQTATLKLPSTAAINEPVEQLSKIPLSWSFWCNTLWENFAPAWLRTPPPTPWTGTPITLNENRTNLRVIRVPPERVAALLSACRERNSSLTSLLNALALASLARRLPDKFADPCFVAVTPISFRPYLNASTATGLSKVEKDQLLGTYVSSYNHRFDAQAVAAIRAASATDDKLMWDAAAELKSGLSARLRAMPQDDLLGMMSWVSDWPARWSAKIGTPREATWEMSGIGSPIEPRAKIDQALDAMDTWQITQIMLTPPATVAGTAINVRQAGVKGGVLSVTIAWQQGVVDAEMMEEITNDFRSWLLGKRR